jgi:hypothetical protein
MPENTINGLETPHKSYSQATCGNTKEEKVFDKDIPCDALKCNNKATEKIELSAGIYGILQINVCKNCIGIFK